MAWIGVILLPALLIPDILLVCHGAVVVNTAAAMQVESLPLTTEQATEQVAQKPVEVQVEKVEGESETQKHNKRDLPKSAVDDNGKYVGQFEEDCSDAQLISPSKKNAVIEVERDILNSGTQCHWNIVGTENCIPALTCKKFNLEPAHGDADDPCPGEYLEVTDGSTGYNKYCGTNGPNNVITSRKLRDMYITLKTSDDSKIKRREFKCQVTCCEKGEDGNKLPDNSEPDIDDNCNCGRKPNGNRIVGGEDAKRGEYPWMAALTTAPTRRPFCGGSVINDLFVLTAAHCFKGPYAKSKNIHVLLNAHTLDLTGAATTRGEKLQAMSRTPEEIRELDEKENTLRFTVAKYFLHPLYIRQTNDFDVALIKLDRPIDFNHNKHVSPVCLPSVEQFSESKEGSSAVVAGWGLNSSEARETMSILQKLHLDVLKNTECKTFFDQRFTKRMMCAGFKEGGKDSCKGDSGGPLISEKTKQVWEQIGVVSWGEGCAAKNSPGVYSNVREVIQWIRYVSNMEGAKWCSG